MEGVAKKKAILDRYNELMMNYSDETADEATKLQDQIDSQNLWDLDSQVEQAMDALGCPPDDADVTHALGRREAPRGALPAAARASPTCCSSTSRPTISTPRPCAWLEKHLRDYPGAILIVTHDRYFLDNVTGWILELDRGRGIPYEGNYSAYLEKKAKRLAQEGREEAARQRALDARARVDRGVARAPARRSRRRASRPMTSCSSATRSARPGTAQIIIPPGERLGDRRHRDRAPVEGLWRPAADRRSDASSCRPAASSASSARTAPARRRCSA